MTENARAARHRSSTSVIVGLLALIAAALGCSEPAAPERPPGVATLTLVGEGASVLRVGQSDWAPAIPGARLHHGDRLRGSCTMKYDNGELMVTRLGAIVEVIGRVPKESATRDSKARTRDSRVRGQVMKP